MNANTNPPVENNPGTVKPTLRALLVEDSADDAELVLAELRRGGFVLEAERVETAETMQAALARQVWDIVISDHSMPHFSAPTALRLLGESGRDVPFIVVSATIGEEVAVAMMKAGAHDFLLKDHLKRLVPVVRRELAEAEGRRQRTRAETELRKLSRAVEQGPMTVLITDATGAIEYVNSKFTELTGYTLEEIRGRNPRVLKGGLTPPAVHEELWETITAGREWRGELHNRKKNGELFWESAVISPLRDVAGRITHFVGAKLDITEQKLANEKIREQAALLDQASDAIYVREPDGTIRFWNAGAERLYGWTAAEIEGRKLGEFALSDIDKQAELAGVLSQTGRWSGEKLQVARDGRKLTVFSRLTQTRDTGGRPAVVIAINTDVTEKKEIEARFLQAQRVENIGALASGLAHDLNNVLAPILMASAILKSRYSDATDQKMVATMEASAQRGADIVRQVLTFARGVKGERIPVHLRHLAREMVEIAAGTFPPTIEVTMDVPKTIWPILGDTTQLHQILMNLCINARDAMPQGGQLSLTAENIELDEPFVAMTPEARIGPYVCFKVTDTGTGIPPENQSKIFEPFFTTKEAGKGTGLGLPTVLGITKDHGGFLRLKSTVGRGTCFEVFLPAKPGVELPGEPGARAKPAQGEGQLILVVDDEPAIRAVTARILEMHGYRCVGAADGSEAMALYVQHAPDIAAVVTDMVMPGMDGPTLVRTLHCVKPELPVLGMTGFGERVGLGRFEALALPALLMKPFTAETLLKTLHAAIHAPPGTKVGSASPWDGATIASIITPS